MRVHIRENFNWERRPSPPDDSITINRYSALMVLVLLRVGDIAERHSHHAVRVEHFIEALLAEPDARQRLSTLGYEDNSEARAQRFQLLARPTFPAGEVPADALRYSDRLQAWLKAAQEVAEGREQELHTIIIDDFILAVQKNADLQDDKLISLQLVLTKYRKKNAPVSFREEVRGRFDKVDGEIGGSHRDMVSRVDAVGWKIDGASTQVGSHIDGVSRQVGGVSDRVGGVSGQVAGVSNQVSEVKADTTVIRAMLPAEMRLSRLLLMMVMLAATFGGACVGLLARWQWGGL